jgi:hypothetical protein
MPHLPCHINLFTEMGHRESMTNITVAAIFPSLFPFFPFLFSFYFSPVSSFFPLPFPVGSSVPENPVPKVPLFNRPV